MHGGSRYYFNWGAASADWGTDWQLCWLLLKRGQRLKVPAAQSGCSSLPTDPPRPIPCSLYVDDGLRQKLQPLMATAASLTADLAYMGKLLAAARTELYVIKKPHRLPAQQYQ